MMPSARPGSDGVVAVASAEPVDRPTMTTSVAQAGRTQGKISATTSATVPSSL